DMASLDPARDTHDLSTLAGVEAARRDAERTLEAQEVALFRAVQRQEEAQGGVSSDSNLRADPMFAKQRADIEASIDRIASLDLLASDLRRAPNTAASTPLGADHANASNAGSPKRMLRDGTIADGRAKPGLAETARGLLKGQSPNKTANEKTQRQRLRYAEAQRKEASLDSVDATSVPRTSIDSLASSDSSEAARSLLDAHGLYAEQYDTQRRLQLEDGADGNTLAGALSDAEYMAIGLYTNGEHAPLNKRLRNGTSNAADRELADLLSSALRNAPGETIHSAPTFRGLNMSDAEIAGIEANRTFSDAGFLSTTTDPAVGRKFAKAADGRKPVLMEIQGRGVDVSDASIESIIESEILFDRNTQFELVRSVAPNHPAAPHLLVLREKGQPEVARLQDEPLYATIDAPSTAEPIYATVNKPAKAEPPYATVNKPAKAEPPYATVNKPANLEPIYATVGSMSVDQLRKSF